MTCIADTASINLTLASGQLSADVVVDPGAGLAPNPLVVNAAGVYVVGSDGWIPLPSTLAFQSADGHTFVATSSADLRSFLGPGDRIRLVQSGVPGYYIVTAIAAGTITLYGGTDYTLAAQPISTPYFSKAKSPIGFPLSPIKWTEELRDTSTRSQASPVAGTWYNPGALSLAVPIGAWRLEYEVEGDLTNGVTNTSLYVTLSTANNSQSDVDLTVRDFTPGASSMERGFSRWKNLLLAVKTSYFLNLQTDYGAASVSFQGTIASTFIRAICTYL